MWVAIGVVAAVGLMILVLLRPPRRTGADGPLPPDVEAQVLLGEEPETDAGREASDEDDRPPCPSEPQSCSPDRARRHRAWVPRGVIGRSGSRSSGGPRPRSAS